MLKQRFEHDNSDLRVEERCQVQSSSVFRWMLNVPIPEIILRPNTAPPFLSTEKLSAPVLDQFDFRLPSCELELDMSQQDLMKRDSVASSSHTKLSISDPLYRVAVHRNGITLDLTGRAIAEEPDIKELLNTYVLKPREGSPPLSDEETNEVVMVAGDLMNYGEGKLMNIIHTRAFPVRRLGVIEGANLLWTTEPLPMNPEYLYHLAAPKPDRHYGYAHESEICWKDEEMNVICHRTAQPYTQPTRENILPFLALEFKAEATGGTLYCAENQCAGSGTHSVASQRWFLKQAFPSQDPATTDAVAFVGTVSSRMAVFYIVWYSNIKARYIMSKIKAISLMEALDIQPCRDLVNNIMDYGMGQRLRRIREALAKLHPIPPHWDEISPS
ncbi:hypothetical protein PABG_07283 [Paracoccidioides brasiliensis Pb03]|nr:hypothetical protein PABG_07283 [Paracoccidioides brasiliensis Pb03]